MEATVGYAIAQLPARCSAISPSNVGVNDRGGMKRLMADAPDDRIVRLFDEAERGEQAASDALFAALYGELRRLADAHLHRQTGQVSLSATTLLHEAYLNIAQRTSLTFPSRGHFLSYASRAMRGLVTDYIRHKHAVKQGGEFVFTSLDDATALAAEPCVDLDKLGRALDDLTALDPELAGLVDLKFFCGFSFVEIAGLRGISERTVQREWAKARLLLHRALTSS
jgi:RNA polymerase sigma factor (TIGR02999 family)